MKIHIVIALLIIVGLGAFVGGAKLGYEQGAMDALALDGTARAVIAISEVRAINNGDYEGALNSLENSINTGIINYGSFKESGHASLVKYTSLGELIPYTEKYME